MQSNTELVKNKPARKNQLKIASTNELALSQLRKHPKIELKKPPRFSIRYSGLNLRPYMHDNISTHINRKAVQKVYNSWDFAEALERPINYYCVIHLDDTVSQSANTAFAKIRRLHGEWLRRRSKRDGFKYQPTYVYSFENPDDNIHVNWCLHIPDTLEKDFIENLDRWVKNTQGPISDKNIFTTKIQYGVDSYKSVANYILKGVDPCLLYTSPSPRDQRGSRMPSSA